MKILTGRRFNVEREYYTFLQKANHRFKIVLSTHVYKKILRQENNSVKIRFLFLRGCSRLHYVHTYNPPEGILNYNFIFKLQIKTI